MKIVVLDGYTLNPGDLDWDALHALGECRIHDRTPPGQTAARCEGADIVLTNKVVMDAPILAALPELRYIGVLATGVNVVDLAAAGDRDILVTNVPAYSTPSVAQMVFAHVLNLTHRVARHAASVRDGAWCRCPDICFWEVPLIELQGLTMGIVGFGQIGRAVTTLALAFGMRVLFYSASRHADRPDGAEQTDELERVFREADVLSLHCPLTPATEKLVNAERLALMKPTAFLINTGRGPLVDAAALADALNGERIAGAGLDVLETEPPPPSDPLLSARNCFITPHIAWASRASRRRLMHEVVANVQAFLDGKPRNVVTA